MAACQLFVVLALFTTVFSSKYEENAKIEHKSLTLGEVLDGDRMAVSMYNINFKQDVANKELCRVRFEEDDLQLLRDAIEDLYYFEFVIDDIPIRGFIGHLEEGGFLPHTHKVYLWAHLHFNIEYNGEHIIYANVSTKEKEPVSLDDVTAPLEVAFTYSVKWHNSGLKYEERSKRLRDNSFFPKTLETRVLKSDFARYNVDDEESEELDQEDNGWKIIHTDVFRFPAYKNLFCAILGVGMQFLTLATGIIIMAMMGLFNVHRHGISGYVATNMYRKMGGDNWVWNINLTSALFAAPFVFVWSLVNSVAWAYGTTQALPFGTIILLMCLWMFVGYPLTVIGGIFGKNWANGFDAPCRTKNISREIPSVPWYRSAFAHCLVGGFLPFSAISVELYYIFSTLWGREQYTLYGILFIVFGILLSVTACISVALTYFQLSAEDYRVFVFLYALFYYYKRSNMSGLLQSLEFFGYTALTCYVFFLMLGTVSFFASLTFVRYIYQLNMDLLNFSISKKDSKM
ncbi:TM9S1-like protein, partial [Mya arenaria]